MAQNEGQSRHPFATNDADLDAALTSSVRDHRGKAALDEVGGVNPAVGRLQPCGDGQIDRSEVRLQQCQVRTGKAR